jgi:hypothetical protein
MQTSEILSDKAKFLEELATASARATAEFNAYMAKQGVPEVAYAAARASYKARVSQAVR